MRILDENRVPVIMKYKYHSSLLLLQFLLCCSSLAAQTETAKHSADLSDVPRKVAIDSDKSIVPMEIFGRKPSLDVKINGKGPYKFFLDTGASATVMDQKLADELNLPTKGTTSIGDPSDPHGITANRNQIDKLEIGGATFTDLIAVSWDRSPLYKEGAPRGVLGMPLFRELLLTVDYPKNQIVIGRGSLAAANGNDILEYKYSEGDLFGIPIKVGSADMYATLDTGSPGGLAFPSEYMEKLSLESKPTEVGRAKTVGGEAVIYGAKMKDPIKLGSTIFENPNITFFGRLTHLNIGYGLISQFALTVDQKNHRIRFAKAAESAKQPTKSAPVKNGKLDEYAGLYDIRRVSVESGEIYLQRLSGPQGEGPKIKLVEITKDAYAMPGTQDVRFKFIRGPHGEITEMQVLNPAGTWETSKRTK
ncbi:hypothetical protein BH10ACI2_BH10ACI2_20080 [soil metagenome]